MPASSIAQQKLFGIALSIRRGESKREDFGKDVLDIVDSDMTDKQIEDFAKTKHKDLPYKVTELFDFNTYTKCNESNLYKSIVLSENVEFYEDTEIDELFNLIEEKINLSDYIPNPIKFIKIKNNAKKLASTLVQQKTIGLETKKKIEASKENGDSSDKIERIKDETEVKKEALSDKVEALNDRLNDLATTDILKTIKDTAVAKAKLKAAEAALKIADDEESKKLRVQIKDTKEKLNKNIDKLKEYEASKEK
jgi:hypothetical protein